MSEHTFVDRVADRGDDGLVFYTIAVTTDLLSDPYALQAVIEQGQYEMRLLAGRPLGTLACETREELFHDEPIPQRWWERLLRRPVRYRSVAGPGSRRLLVIREVSA